MSVYGQELADAERRGLAAYEAMEAWLARPFDAPDVPGAVLEGYAKDLRESREVLRGLLAEHGSRDDIDAALERSEGYHRAVGLSIKDKPDFEPSDEEENEDAGA